MAVLTAAEVNEQADLSYVRGTYYIALTNSATVYDSTLSYSTVQADEVTAGTGGYARLSYTYSASDLLAYSNGQPVAQKVANFVHNGSTDDIVFNNIVLLREVSGTYSVVGFQELGETVIITNGNIAKININILHGVS